MLSWVEHEKSFITSGPEVKGLKQTFDMVKYAPAILIEGSL